jgi:hypothetical protein
LLPVSLKSSRELLFMNHDTVILVVLKSCSNTNVVDIGQIAVEQVEIHAGTARSLRRGCNAF